MKKITMLSILVWISLFGITYANIEKNDAKSFWECVSNPDYEDEYFVFKCLDKFLK